MKEIQEKKHASFLEHEKIYSVCFYVGHSRKSFEIGEKVNKIHEEAYMNGYNWEAFFNYYLTKHHPDILEHMDTDPEAGMYAAYFKKTVENKKRAKQFIGIINELMENEEVIYELIRQEGNQIEWD